jgi:lipoyl-dependent peroxiredoxin
MKRNATAVWNGPGKTGKGTLSTQSGLLSDLPYTWASRFEENPGTNPEELVAAAHAGCFSMKLSFVLGSAGIEPQSIQTTCTVTLESGAITTSHLKVAVSAEGLTKEVLDKCVDEAKNGCPISKSLNANITAEASIAG